MNINRNNYEEYFLLYVDNELSAAEKNMVEIFVTNNPDLKEELVMLQQSIIRPEEISFAGKAGLLKTLSTEAITTETLLLLLDKELPAKQQAALLKQIEQDDNLSKEWQLLQQTTLSPSDTITFENKSLLYRKEEKERRVIAMRWWQMAAAAVLVGFALWGTVSYINNNGGAADPSQTVNNNHHQPVKQLPSPTGLPGKESNKTNTDVPGNANNNVATTDVPAENKSSNKQPAVQNKRTQPVNPINQVDYNTVAQQPLYKNNTTANGLQNINSANSNPQDIANVQPSIKDDRNTLINEAPETSSVTKNEYAINTSAGGSDEIGFGDDDEEDRPKKSKLGGFFKRVKRTFERTTKIKTGSNDDVKIANMSFAMH